MSDRDLAVQADAAFRRTTVPYTEWQKRLAAGKYADPLKTAWGEGFDALAKIGAAPVATLGSLLLAKYPPPAPPTAGVFKINSFDEFMNAWANPVAGADYDGQGKTFSGPAKDYFFRAALPRPARFRNCGIEGGSRLLVAVGASNVSLGNTMREPLRIKGGRPDCLKLDGGSNIFWDGLILEDSPGQGLLVGSDSAPAVKGVRGFNWITRRNGSNTNKDHGAYLAHVDGFCFANWLSESNYAFQSQMYPQAVNGLVVNYTGWGGVTRGGVIIGTEPGNAEPTRSVKHIGCISAKAPYAAGFAVYNSAPGCPIEDSMVWDVSGPDVYGLPAVNVQHADPRFVDAAAGDFRPRDGGVVREENWGWLAPTDLYGVPRGPHTGALAVAL